MSNEIDAGQAAQLLYVSRQHFTDKLSKLPGFPKPCVNHSARARRWRYDEILRWRQKERRAA